MGKVLFSLLFWLPVLAYGFPLPDGARPFHDGIGYERFLESESYDYSGIVALSNCSGSFVRFEESQGSDFGLILTNGHCVRLLGKDEVMVREPARRSIRFLAEDGSYLGRGRTETLLYAAMKGTDMALYELDESYDELFDRLELTPLLLASTRPTAGTSIQIISGYWRRGYTCQIDDLVYELREGNYVFWDSLRYTRPGCEVIGGTSGSPILAFDRTVIAVNNTINERGRRCSLNNPCEVNQKGEIRYERGLGYGQQTYWIYSCLNEQRDLDLSLPECQLAKPNVAI